MNSKILFLMLSLSAGSILFAQKPETGVPRIDPDYQMDVREWWAGHPFNPEGKNFRPAIRSPEPVVELKSGESIQQAVAFLPRQGGTIKLAPGTYPPFRIIGQSHVHILGPEPGAGAAIITGYSRISIHIDATDGGFWNHETAHRPEPMKWHYLSRRLWEIHKEPPRDFYLKNLVFDGRNIDGEDGALRLQRVFDVVFDNCTFRNFVNRSSGHRGLVNGHMGLNNIWFRDCKFAGSAMFITYLDGAHGCGFINCAIEAAGFKNPAPLFLTNHDYTYDLNENGKIERDEERNAKYIVVYGNKVNGAGSSFVQITGENILVQKNTCSGGMDALAFVDEPGPIAHFSYPYGAVRARILDNQVKGPVKQALLVQRVAAAQEAAVTALPEAERFTIENNTAANTPPPASIAK